MATTHPLPPRKVSILILDDDPASQSALRQILDAEGWRVRHVPDARALLSELATGEWSLVIADIALTGTDSPAFHTLREVAGVPADQGGRVRVLYLIPASGGAAFVPAIEQARLPFALRPFHLHDFLEKVSDLLVETGSIEAPIRQVRREFSGPRKKKDGASRNNSMFAARDSYSYTEEELAEFERQEQENASLRKKRQNPRNDLGRPQR
jgi:DNA-binding NtrC family response regulator